MNLNNAHIKNVLRISTATFFILLVIFIDSCKKDKPTTPIVTTTAVSGNTYTTATSGGNITSDGGAAIAVRGVCWGTAADPTTALSTITSDGSGIGTFTSSITSLTAGTSYFVRAYATNSAGTSYGAGISFSTTAATVPGAPTIGTATPGNAQATVAFTVPGSNGGSAITGYTVISSPGSKSGTGTASPITVTGLSNGTAYTFTVTATNSAGNSLTSSASNSVTPSTVPGSPTGVTALAGNGQSAVTFTAPVSNGGSAITGYTVTSSPSGFLGTGTASPITVTGLTNGTTYTFTVTATNATGTSVASSASNSVTPSATTIPGAPTIGTATPGNAQATISFTAPVSNGGSVITGYTVTSNPGGITSTGTASPITVTGLTIGTTYTFTVTATNATGISVASSASNSVTPSTTDNIVLNNIMTGLKIVEKLKPGSFTMSVNQAQMLSTNYNSCTKVGDYLVYTKSAESLDRTNWPDESGTAFTGNHLPTGLQIKFAWGTDGTVYMGAIGSDDEVLATMVEGAGQIGQFSNTDTFFEGYALLTELLNLKTAALATGIPAIADLSSTNFYSSLSKTIFNRFTKPIYRVFSAIYLQSSPGVVTNWPEGVQWCPFSGSTTGTGSRSFSLTFSNPVNSYFCASAGSDNSNSSYVKLDGTIVSQMSKYYGNFYRRTGTYPATIMISATISWSGATPYFRMAIVGDGITATNVVQTPSGGLSNNQAPIINSIPVYY